MSLIHYHPYDPIIPDGATKLIVGTLPPPRFMTKQFKENDVDFPYGSGDGQLRIIIDTIFDLGLEFAPTQRAKQQRLEFLTNHHIGIADIVVQATRERPDAADLTMTHIQLRNLLGILENHPQISMLLFTGGNSKNGPEYFLRRHLREHNLHLTLIDSSTPRIHKFSHPVTHQVITTVSLTAPSGSANRAVGSMLQYKDMKNKNPDYTTIDFRVEQYRPFFVDS